MAPLHMQFCQYHQKNKKKKKKEGRERRETAKEKEKKRELPQRTQAVVFAETDEAESHRKQAGVHEEGDGIVRRIQLRSASEGRDACDDQSQQGGRAEGGFGAGGGHYVLSLCGVKWKNVKS